MNLSLNWLNDFVDTKSIPIPELLSGLTMSGSKVEKCKNLSEPLSKIVIGKVVEIKKHENSDKLWVCQVDTGGFDSEEPNIPVESIRQIVTGAQNVFEGAIVPVVLDGGVVLNRQDSSAVKIKKGKLRGEASEGMLCSPDELGLDKSDFPNYEDGILILDETAPVGGCVPEFLGLNDNVIEFEITNNRPDCLAITGLAREVAATFDLPLNIPTPEFKGYDGDINSELSVSVENKQLCSRYMAGLVKNVKIAPSPKWMAARLKAQGVRPINNIVDITNYVMLEYGNPLHAFDKRFIEGDGIIVRNASDNEKITLLDGNTVTLDPNILVISSASKGKSGEGTPLAVAGVMGGEYSGVVEDTATVVFEAACFDGVSVRRASKKIGRRTESSVRFEKGLNPVNVKASLMRALQLVEELGIGEVCNTIIDCANYEKTEKSVPHDFNEINKFLGTDIPEDEQLNIFKKLGFEYKNNSVIVPTTRSDIKLPCDLAEEVARIYGYNKIKSTLPPISPLPPAVPSHEKGIRKLVNSLTSQGCYECITYSFVSPNMADKNAVKIRNPFGEETSVMRTSMIPSILKVIKDNINAGNAEARLFEIGRIYTNNKEPDMLCIGLYGKGENFYTLKGIIEELLYALNINTDFELYTETPFHQGRAARCDCLKLGEISPLVLRDYDIDERVYIAEIDVSKLFDKVSDKVTYTPIPKYPAAVRDLSLVCDDEIASGDIIKLIKQNKTGNACLENVEFFDVFKGGNLEKCKKSLSYKLTFRKTDGTLTDEEVDTAIEKILSKLEQNNIKLRG